jgi:hypothetical protein
LLVDNCDKLKNEVQKQEVELNKKDLELNKKLLELNEKDIELRQMRNNMKELMKGNKDSSKDSSSKDAPPSKDVGGKGKTLNPVNSIDERRPSLANTEVFGFVRPYNSPEGESRGLATNEGGGGRRPSLPNNSGLTTDSFESPPFKSQHSSPTNKQSGAFSAFSPFFLKNREGMATENLTNSLNPSDWTDDEVSYWLVTKMPFIGPKYVWIFRDNGIDGKMLCGLRDDEIVEVLMVDNGMHLGRIRREIELLKETMC